MISNSKSLRVNSSSFLFLMQCLYQNKIIDAKEKQELALLLKDCLSNEHSVNSKRNLSNRLNDFYYKEDIPTVIKSQLYDCISMLD